MPIERPDQRPAGLVDAWRDLDATHAASGLVGFVFAASGPLAIIVAVGSKGGLTETQIASWIFGAFALNALITLAFSLIYRQPLAFFWTIPGTVLVGPALEHLSFPEVVGAFLVTGLLMLVLGLSGLVRRAMDAVPMPIVMGMVAGVFLQFGLDWIAAFEKDVMLAVPMTAVFLALSAVPALARRCPPLIAALAVGVAIMMTAGTFTPQLTSGAVWAVPEFVRPAFSWGAMVELVLPLAVTVLAAQNAQGIAVLTTAGHRPPVTAITVACGVGSILTAAVGTVSTCLTGPTNAILAASGRRETQYAAGVFLALLAVAFGLLAPLVTRTMLAAPPAFIATLAGLAMLRVLQGAFLAAFKGPFGFGALITFLVTVSGTAILSIGAPFWGLVFGYAASRLIEPADFGRPAGRD